MVNILQSSAAPDTLDLTNVKSDTTRQQTKHIHLSWESYWCIDYRFRYSNLFDNQYDMISIICLKSNISSNCQELSFKLPL